MPLPFLARPGYNPGIATSAFARALLDWYDVHSRDLPWRQTRDPYGIWVSEIMLQQTQVATVLPYYEAWMARFPTVESLANAEEREALAMWQGLGYYRRCRSLLEGVRRVSVEGMPMTGREWLCIPGVGAYTAAAIASICHAEPCAVVDGNVERVFARIAACDSTGSALTRQAREWSQSRMPVRRPADWNQAMMELGATICTPRSPNCSACPVRRWCRARKLRRQTELPVRPVKRAAENIEYFVAVPIHNDRCGIRPVEGRWWNGLWEFPRYDSDEALRSAFSQPIRDLITVRHTVTHHRLIFFAHILRERGMRQDLTWVSLDELKSYPLPSPQRKIASAAISFLRK